MTNYAVGHEAELAAVDYLRRQKFTIVDTNWRTRVCEVDIIAKKANHILFVEVKYRSSSRQGNGLDYITPAKLKRMSFAAEVWVGRHAWKGSYDLAAVEVSDYPFRITGFISSLTI